MNGKAILLDGGPAPDQVIAERLGDIPPIHAHPAIRQTRAPHFLGGILHKPARLEFLERRIPVHGHLGWAVGGQAFHELAQGAFFAFIGNERDIDGMILRFDFLIKSDMFQRLFRIRFMNSCKA